MPKPLLTAASIGKRYVRRDGKISQPLATHEPSNPRVPYLWKADGWRYVPNGGLFWDDPTPNDEDLIRLATPDEIRAGKALPVKERKAKEGRKHQSWCYEVCAGGRWQIQVESTRKEARNQRHEDREIGWRVGPIFKVTITCPVCNPK